MKKVFIVHGFEGMPNGGWRPWLLGKLGRDNKIYGCALPMPNEYDPKVSEWVSEISRVSFPEKDEIILVGHSLGVPAILRYLEQFSDGLSIKGAILVSGPIEPIQQAQNENSLKKIDSFINTPFDFEKIKKHCKSFSVIHGDNDNVVPFAHAEKLSQYLSCELIPVKNGLHLSGGAGWYELPEALTAIEKMFSS